MAVIQDNGFLFLVRRVLFSAVAVIVVPAVKTVTPASAVVSASAAAVIAFAVILFAGGFLVFLVPGFVVVGIFFNGGFLLDFRLVFFFFRRLDILCPLNPVVGNAFDAVIGTCLLYTSDAADD